MNLPEDFKKQLFDLEIDVEAYEKCFAEQHTSLRIHPLKWKNHFSDLKKIAWTSYGFYLPKRPKFTYDPLFHAGTYYVQEASSMFLEQAFLQTFDINQNLKILDLCAAPGGKSTHILSLIGENSFLVSNEVIHSRTQILKENIQKSGYSNVVVTQNDPKNFSALEGFFDVLIIDAPCSGEGLFRKNSDAISEWSLQNVELCYMRQRRILMGAWDCLKKNGVLIYSTCTFNKKENEENLKWLSEQTDVEFLKLKIDSEWGIIESEIDGVSGYRFYPHKLKGEGFFVSVIRKKSGVEEYKFPKKLISHFKDFKQEIGNWFNTSFELKLMNDKLVALNPQHIGVIDELLSKLNVFYVSTEIGEIKNKDIIPTQALLLSNHFNISAFPIFELDYDDAIRFLKRENIQKSISSVQGWLVITYQNLPLGWAKNVGSRLNNYYPKEWRIRH